MTAPLIDLSKVPLPDLVEVPEFEALYQEVWSEFATLYSDHVNLRDSDPVNKLLQLFASRLQQWMQTVNDRNRRNYLATATGEDLDVYLADYDMARLVIDPGDPDALPPVPPAMESDDAFRRRGQLRFDSAADGGGAYDNMTYRALTASGEVRDVVLVAEDRPPEDLRPNELDVHVLAHGDTGIADAELQGTVHAAIRDCRALNDFINVLPADVVPLDIAVTLLIGNGPDAGLVIADAERLIRAEIEADTHPDGDGTRPMGRLIATSALIRAAMRPGAQRAEVTSPADDIQLARHQAARVNSITITVGDAP